MINTFPQKLKAIKCASTNSIQDERFKKWLDGDIYQEDINRKKPVRKKSNKLAKDVSSSDEQSIPSIESASALINSSISSSSSLATSNIDEYHTDFLMAVDMKTTIQTVVEFSPVNNNLFVVNTKKEPNEYPDRQEIIRKLVAFLGNQNIFKKRTSLYNESIHGSLYLIVFYGHIYFFQNKFPDKLGPLKKYITAEESNKIMRFNYANFDKFFENKVQFK
ncbi:unnamed protein product, partial [Rotaria sp. Silwood1]